MKRSKRLKRRVRQGPGGGGDSITVATRFLRWAKGDPLLTMKACRGAATGCYTLMHGLSTHEWCKRCIAEGADKRKEKKKERNRDRLRDKRKTDMAEVIDATKNRRLEL